jgi:hypothetical protein
MANVKRVSDWNWGLLIRFIVALERSTILTEILADLIAKQHSIPQKEYQKLVDRYIGYVEDEVNNIWENELYHAIFNRSEWINASRDFMNLFRQGKINEGYEELSELNDRIIEFVSDELAHEMGKQYRKEQHERYR